MKYYAQMNRRVRDVHVYTVLKRIGGSQHSPADAFAKIFARIFGSKKGEAASAAEKLS